MKKKVFALVLCIAMLAIAIAGGTLAYFTDNDAKTNTITVGNVSIVLTEPNWDTTGAAEAKNVYPGEALPKDPTVTNDGKNPCFIRISVTGWDALINAGLSSNNIFYRTGTADSTLGADWVLHTDGYFYYTKVVQPGESTTALFDYVVIPTDVVNDATNVEYNLEVKAFACQSEGSGIETVTADAIAAWMTTCLG